MDKKTIVSVGGVISIIIVFGVVAYLLVEPSLNAGSDSPSKTIVIDSSWPTSLHYEIYFEGMKIKSGYSFHEWPDYVHTIGTGNYSLRVSAEHHFPFWHNFTLNNTQTELYFKISGQGGIYAFGTYWGSLQIWPSTTSQVTDKWHAEARGYTLYRIVTSDGLTIPVNETTYMDKEIGESFTFQHWANVTETYHRNEIITASWTRWINGTEYYRIETSNKTIVSVPEYVYYKYSVGDTYNYASFNVIYTYDNDQAATRGNI